jgi:hypothetical protein
MLALTGALPDAVVQLGAQEGGLVAPGWTRYLVSEHLFGPLLLGFHYGATFQLARALDQAGKPAEARPWWEKVLTLADGYKDAATAGIARARLQRKE